MSGGAIHAPATGCRRGNAAPAGFNAIAEGLPAADLPRFHAPVSLAPGTAATNAGSGQPSASSILYCGMNFNK